MWSKLGIFSLLAGFFIGVFSGISNFMGSDNFWVNLTLSDLIGDFSDSLVEAVPVQAVQDGLSFIVFDLHFGWLLAGLSLIFFLISTVVKEH
ncbi:hypothetical protein [Desulfospira joergensenii]|uniref:hypothetical protein n=1 Tax=Desulfospira joergensenii TaxID=53329 RepID=UPI0003B73759|nr:hypothetical protein [Desulfospira joergensenii]